MGPAGASMRAGREGAKIVKKRRLLPTDSLQRDQNPEKLTGSSQRQRGSRPSAADVRCARIVAFAALRRHGHCGGRRRNPLCSGDGAAAVRRRVQSRRVRRNDNEGQSRQRLRKDRRGCEGFTTRPAEARVARKSQAAEVAGARAQRCGRIFRNRRCLPRYRQRKIVASSAAGNLVRSPGGHGAFLAQFSWYFGRRQ